MRPRSVGYRPVYWLLFGCCSLTVSTSSAFLRLPTTYSTRARSSNRFHAPNFPHDYQRVGMASSSKVPPSNHPSGKAKKRRHRNSNHKETTTQNVDDIVAKMGLTTVSSTRTKCVQKRNSNSNYTLLRRPSVQNQLDYARNGHTALRMHLDPLLLQQVRRELEQHGRKHELLAWRQKVEVATGNHSPNLAHCESVDDCIRELDRLGISWDRLPFLQYFNTWRDISPVKELANDLAETAAILLDVPSVRLYQDSFFWKRSQDGPTPWHTDARMAPFDTASMLTIWIPLHDIPRDGTALHFVSKSHADFALPFWNPYKEMDDSQSQWNMLEERYQHHKIANHMPLAMGDVTVHSGWTLHCADSQFTSDRDSKEDRLALAISYVDARAPIRENVLSKEDHGDDEDQWSYLDWVTEIPPRQEFEHPLVPIVWPR